MKLKIALIGLFISCLTNSFAQNYARDNRFWIPDNDVNEVLIDSINGLVYIGGSFSYIGPIAPFGSVLDTNNVVLETISHPNNNVNTSIPDGAGGWYIGGDFTKIGDTPRMRIAHIDSSGNVIGDLGREGFDNKVTSLSLRDSVLYVGGNFSSYGGQIKYASEVYLDSLYCNKLFPQTNGTVYASVPDGSGGVFIGGSFSMVGDSVRRNLAHININGEVMPLGVGTNSTVYTLLLKDDILYFGGLFSVVNTDSIQNVAAYNLASNTLENLNLDFSISFSYVRSLKIHGDSLFIGGYFPSINSLPMAHLGLVNLQNYSLIPWYHSINEEVSTMDIRGNELFIGGWFDSVQGQSRNHLASLMLSSLTLTSFQPNVNGIVRKLLVDDSTLYFGGVFTTVDSSPRTRIASININSGALTSWDPLLNDEVQDIYINDSVILISGGFTSCEGTQSNNIARFDKQTGNHIPWLLTLNNDVYTISPLNQSYFLGGSFVYVDSYYQNYLAGINLNNNLPVSWNPVINNPVTDLIVADSLLFFSGTFSTVNGVSRSKLAVFDLNDHSLEAYSPNPDGKVNCMKIDDGHLYLGGEFTQFDAQSRNRLAKIDLQNLSLQSWNPSCSGYVNALAINDTNVFIGGNFTQINGIGRIDIANTDKITGNLLGLSFTPVSITGSGTVYELALKDSLLLVGAQYYTQTYDDFKHLFAINLNQGSVDPFFPHADLLVNSISVSDGKTYVGGTFSSAGGSYAHKLARYDISSGKLSPWRTKIIGSVSDMLLEDSVLFIGGTVSSVNGQTCGNIAAINIHNSQLIPWPVTTDDGNSLTNDNVRALVKKGDTVFVSGNFNTINGQPQAKASAVSYPSGNILNWNHNLIYNTYDLEIFGNYLYSTGAETDRFSLPSLEKDTTWSFENHSVVHSIVIKDSTILLCGLDYTDSNNIYYNGLTELDTVSGTVLNNVDQLRGRFFAACVDHKSLYTSYSSQFDNRMYESNKINRDTLSGPFPEMNGGTIWSMRKKDSKLFLGGNFTGINDEAAGRFVVLDVCETSLDPTMQQVADCNSYTWPENNETYNRSGIYSHLLNSASGCDSIVFIQVDIQKDSIIDTQIHCSSYTWINGLTYTASTNSPSLTFTNQAGCDSIVTLNLTIVDHPAAQAVYNGDGTLTATGIGDFQWVNCLTFSPVFGETNAVFAPAQNGNYAVIVDNGYCADTSACIPVIDLNVEEITDLNTFNISPNPANNQVRVNFSGSNADLTVYDLQGKVVLKDRIQNNGTISLQNFERGVYLFDFNNSQGHSVQRVVKQ
ncbi:MAG: T9SS type A sorting domain-containing protein [Fluviicola sp.]